MKTNLHTLGQSSDALASVPVEKSPDKPSSQSGVVDCGESAGTGVDSKRMKTEWLDLRLMDCMDLMCEFPDKHFDLAIVDPPYGIGEDGGKCRTRGSKKTNGPAKGWDKSPPPPLERWKW
jgi:hypothetical protein